MTQKQFLVGIIVVVMLAIPIVHAGASPSNSWTNRAPLPVPNVEYDAVVVNGTVYLIGTSAIFDPSSNSWNITNVNYAYDPTTDMWTARAPMLTPRVSFAAAACGNKIYVIGGMEETPSKGLVQITCSVNEVYDPSTNTWTTKASMPISRMQMGAATVNGKIYVMGGMTAGAYSTVNITQIYDPATDSWASGASMPYPVDSYVSAVVDNKIYVIGGQDEYLYSMQTDQAVNFTQIYNPATNTWSLGAAIPAPTWQAAAAATTGVMAPKRIYVIGGMLGLGVGSNNNFVYDPNTNSWTAAAPMPTARYNPAVAAVNDILYAIGGGYHMSSLAVNEQYIPIGYNQTIGATFPSPSTYPSIKVSSLNMLIEYLIVTAVLIAIISVFIAYIFKRRTKQIKN